MSRRNTLRKYKISDDTLTVTCYDTTYYSYSIKNDSIVSLDPDGGPYFSVGGIHRNWIIQKIISHNRKESKIIFVFDVKKIN
jgi:hypothetical protein